MYNAHMSPKSTPKRPRKSAAKVVVVAPATEQTYSLKEVAAQVGVELRVLRSWMGHPYRILPGFGRGSGTRYPQAFLDRAKLAQRLRDEHLPLAEVANRLRGVPDQELEQLLNGTPAPSGRASKGSAADYAAAVLNSRGVTVSLFERAKPVFQQSLPIRKQPLARAAWERIPLSDAIEVHARRPMTREENRLLDDLLKEAERIFGPQPRGNS
jgi:DNA-binding transcriptional MerR regulator